MSKKHVKYEALDQHVQKPRVLKGPLVHFGTPWEPFSIRVGTLIGISIRVATLIENPIRVATLIENPLHFN